MAIVMVGMLDEREEGLQLIKDHIERRGHKAVLMDISIGTGAITSSLKPEIAARELAEAAGTTADSIKEMLAKERDKATSLMADGLGKKMLDLYGSGDLEGVFAELDSTAKRLGASADTELNHPFPKPAQPSGKPDKPLTLPPLAEALERVGMSGVMEKKRLATRVAYGVGLVALGDISDRVVSLDGDVSNSTFANLFEKAHPNRFFECKIAEHNMVTVASGMSAAGKIPFASTFGKFLARAVDQIDMASISRANIKLVGSHTGVSLGADGPSQMAVSDMAYFRSMTRVDTGNGTAACCVFHPSDPICAYRCCELMARIDGLCYLRTHRPETPFLYAVDEQFEVGGSKKLRSGDNLTLVSSGFMVHSVLEVARKLADQGIDCNVFDAYSFPLKTADILGAARKSGGTILTIEDNYAGGLHAEMAEAAAEAGEVRVSGMTVKRIPKSAKSADEVFSHVGVGVEQIIENATRLANKGR